MDYECHQWNARKVLDESVVKESSYLCQYDLHGPVNIQDDVINIRDYSTNSGVKVLVQSHSGGVFWLTFKPLQTAVALKGFEQQLGEQIVQQHSRGIDF